MSVVASAAAAGLRFRRHHHRPVAADPRRRGGLTAVADRRVHLRLSRCSPPRWTRWCHRPRAIRIGQARWARCAQPRGHLDSLRRSAAVAGRDHRDRGCRRGDQADAEDLRRADQVRTDRQARRADSRSRRTDRRRTVAARTLRRTPKRWWIRASTSSSSAARRCPPSTSLLILSRST